MSDIDLRQFASVQPQSADAIPEEFSSEEEDASPVDKQDKTKHSSVRKPRTPSMKKSHKIIIRVLAVFFVITAILAIVGWQASIRAQRFMAMAQDVRVSAASVYDAIKNQNLTEASAKLKETKSKYGNLRAEYDQYKFLGSVPVANSYYADGVAAMNAGEAGLDAAEMAIVSIEPYADVLGFSGSGAFTGGTVENRIQLALATLSKIGPNIDQIISKLNIVGTELNKIDEKRYPIEFRGQKIRENIVMVKDVSKNASQAITEFKPVLDVLPDLAGATGKRKKYFVLFQNDNELRPTGGFMTAYARLNVEKGVVSPESSDDIYELDKRFTKKPEIPPILKRYLTTEKKWNLRDMNISPDFKESIETFWKYYSTIPRETGNDVDGIIAIDTNVLERLVEILGPVNVSGYGTFTAEKDARCDCPQIIYALSEIVDRPTPYIRENRKGIIGPMMQSILSKAYGAPRQQWPALFSEAWNSIQGKHVQFYFFDPKYQQAAEAVNSAGRLQAPKTGEDYFFAVDANLGGAKSNLFVSSSVAQEISVPENGRMTKMVTMTYKNPFKPSNCNLEAGQLCLNARLFNWQRLYLPKGAVLVKSSGYDQELELKVEGDHAIAEGVFTVDPLGAAKLSLTYTIPYENDKEYILNLQKQGGTQVIPYLLTVNGGEHEVKLDKDKTVRFDF